MADAAVEDFNLHIRGGGLATIDLVEASSAVALAAE